MKLKDGSGAALGVTVAVEPPETTRSLWSIWNGDASMRKTRAELNSPKCLIKVCFLQSAAARRACRLWHRQTRSVSLNGWWIMRDAAGTETEGGGRARDTRRMISRVASGGQKTTESHTGLKTLCCSDFHLFRSLLNPYATLRTSLGWIYQRKSWRWTGALLVWGSCDIFMHQ